MEQQFFKERGATIAEAARYLGLAEASIRTYLRDRHLRRRPVAEWPHRRCVLVDVGSLDEYRRNRLGRQGQTLARRGLTSG